MSDAPTIVLETDRLILRLLTLDDLDALAELYRHPEVRKFYPEGTLTREEVQERLERIVNVDYGQYGFGLWATIHKGTGEFIGRCGLMQWTIDGGQEVEVAYMMARAYWGQGLATEAAGAILHYAFEQLGYTRLICLIDPQNQASRRVAEKIGLTLEKEGDVNGYPTALYSIQR